LKYYSLLFKYQSAERSKSFKGSVKIEEKANTHFIWSSIAAVILVVLGSIYFYDTQQPLKTSNIIVVTEEEQALEKTKQTLKMVSKLMNEGSADLVYLKEFNKTKDQIIKLN